MSVRGVRQLSHLFLSYKPGQPSSRVVEEFLQSPLLQQFKDKHPGVVVDTLKTVKNNPFLSASYGQSNACSSSSSSSRSRSRTMGDSSAEAASRRRVLPRPRCS
jgi:hypothetical protein